MFRLAPSLPPNDIGWGRTSGSGGPAQTNVNGCGGPLPVPSGPLTANRCRTVLIRQVEQIEHIFDRGGLASAPFLSQWLLCGSPTGDPGVPPSLIQSGFGNEKHFTVREKNEGSRGETREGVRKVAQLMLGRQLNFDAAVTCL